MEPVRLRLVVVGRGRSGRYSCALLGRLRFRSSWDSASCLDGVKKGDPEEMKSIPASLAEFAKI